MAAVNTDSVERNSTAVELLDIKTISDVEASVVAVGNICITFDVASVEVPVIVVDKISTSIFRFITSVPFKHRTKDPSTTLMDGETRRSNKYTIAASLQLYGFNERYLHSR